MKLIAIPNLSATSASEIIPWQFTPAIPKKMAKADKPAFVDWCTHPSTKHCFFSAFEGLVASLRVSAGANPPTVLHGLVADYDTQISDDMWASLPDRCKTEFMPICGSATFSGGARLIWEFDEPLVLSSWKVTKAFLKIVARKMGLSKLLPGFDTTFYERADQYFEVGRDWRMISSDKIPCDLLWVWMTEAGDSVKEKVQVRIPLPKVAEAVDKKFPGKWKGAFELGSRGTRFWDSGADNRTASVVREGGMQCFTGAQGFVSWAELFGQRWVDQFSEEQTGVLLRDWWYDGTQFWTKDPELNSWYRITREDFKLMCKVKYGLSNVAGKANASEIDTLMFQVQANKRVEGVFPRVHYPDGLYVENSKRCLNTCVAQCMRPAPGLMQWGEKFPWLASFFDTFFYDNSQKNVFLSWLYWFYTNGVAHKPKSGQAVFIAGDRGIGKTLLSTGIIGPMVGGHQDARSFLTGEGGNFTDYILESPLLTMDDAEPATDTRSQTRFSNNVKRMVANPYHHFDKKFRDSGQTVWMGRIMVSCNLDPESLRVLPSLELSNRDKVILLRAATTPRDFLPMQEMQALIAQELPYFCNWLTNWEIPEENQGEVRFGIKAYHDPVLADAAAQGESSYAFSELLDEFRVRWWKFSGETHWVGSATALLSTLVSTPDLEVVTRPFADSRIISRGLGKLVARGCPSIEMMERSQQKIWRIAVSPDSWPNSMLNRETHISSED